MGLIFYGVCGEGRGHATRVYAIVEELRKEHEIVIFTYDDALVLLAPMYENTSVRIVEIPGVRFSYSDTTRKLDYLQTGLKSCGYIRKLYPLVERLCDDIERECPDLIISDFEPALPRAANRMDVPFISINHQHFLLVSDLRHFPMNIRLQVGLMRSIVRTFYAGQLETIVSSFFFPKLLRKHADAKQVGVLLRPDVLKATAYHGDHLVAYFRRSDTNQMIEALHNCGRDVYVYGLGSSPSVGNLRFKAIHSQRFIEDLATSDGLVCTAGNQLVGEALYLGKPVLAVPEEGNYEQFINSYYLNKSGGGKGMQSGVVSSRDIKQFIENIEQYRGAIDRERINGNTETLRLLENYLPTVTRQPPPTIRYAPYAVIGNRTAL